MTATRQHLLGWVYAHGLAALDELFRTEAVALAGRKGRHQAARTHHHWGTTATELTFGGRRLQVRRPRVRGTNGQEATLPSVAAFRTRDPLSARMMQQLLAGVSTRNYEASLEPRPAGRPGGVSPHVRGRRAGEGHNGLRIDLLEGGRRYVATPQNAVNNGYDVLPSRSVKFNAQRDNPLLFGCSGLRPEDERS